MLHRTWWEDWTQKHKSGFRTLKEWTPFLPFQFHFPPLSLLCPSSLPLGQHANSVGVIYVNYHASTTLNIFLPQTYIDHTWTQKSVSMNASLLAACEKIIVSKDKRNRESEEMSWRRMPDVQRRRQRGKKTDPEFSWESSEEISVYSI